MKGIEKIINHLQSLTKKEFKKRLSISLLILAIICLTAIYYIYNESSSLVQKIKTIERVANKATDILNENKKMEFEEKRLTTLLEANKEFNIKSFFEQFYQQQGMTPEPNWDTIVIPVEGNDKFDEVILNATFKKQTTTNLTRILDALDKNEMVYIKELTVKKEENKQISIQMLLATKRYKPF